MDGMKLRPPGPNHRRTTLSHCDPTQNHGITFYNSPSTTTRANTEAAPTTTSYNERLTTNKPNNPTSSTKYATVNFPKHSRAYPFRPPITTDVRGVAIATASKLQHRSFLLLQFAYNAFNLFKKFSKLAFISIHR
ncbi:hypothetical protein RND81_10G029800 [Saponaria officinalis]|uniref:Uncharacterized protein n=1 Tax=Saponaria officinalis TaxID=3572 RepID=A0AAW1HYH1_SAPOF